MFERLSIPRLRLTTTAGSAAIHVAVVAAMLHLAHTRPIRVYLPGTDLGSTVQLTYIPGRAPVPRLSAKPKAKPANTAHQIKKPLPALPEIDDEKALVAPPRPELTPLRQSSADSNAPASETPNATSGSDSWGSGDIQIALTTYSPSPRPDLSRLPRGLQGDVVLDVTIDPTGRVADLQVLRALGYGVESNVVETVKRWTFRPATRDGVPVASVQELHFHYGPA
jgi:periplasmic protein TonB